MAQALHHHPMISSAHGISALGRNYIFLWRLDWPARSFEHGETQWLEKRVFGNSLNLLFTDSHLPKELSAMLWERNMELLLVGELWGVLWNPFCGNGGRRTEGTCLGKRCVPPNRDQGSHFLSRRSEDASKGPLQGAGTLDRAGWTWANNRY